MAAYFEASLYANLKEEEKLEYDRIMDTKYDIEDSLLDAELKGEKRGEAKMQLEIANRFSLSSLRFSTIEDLVASIGLPKDRICTHCFDGSSAHTLDQENK